MAAYFNFALLPTYQTKERMERSKDNMITIMSFTNVFAFLSTL